MDRWLAKELPLIGKVELTIGVGDQRITAFRPIGRDSQLGRLARV